jgi:hypothetical protein
MPMSEKMVNAINLDIPTTIPQFTVTVTLDVCT